MLEFSTGLMLGFALGLIVIGFLAVAAYQRGLDDASFRRRAWRTELVARRTAVREMPAAGLKKAS